MSEAAVIMAAGKGTRMKSDLPKVCHRAASRCLVEWVVSACQDAGVGRIVVVVGYQREKVQAALAGYDVEFAVQEQQLGTGHAAAQAASALAGETGTVYVLNGDAPMVDASHLELMRAAHRDGRADMTLASMIPSAPLEYGRVVRGADGLVLDVIEERDCTPEQAAIVELNIGMYAFNSPGVWDVFAQLGNSNAAGEYYITDMARHYARTGGRVVAVQVPEAAGLGVNTVEQLELATQLLLARQAV